VAATDTSADPSLLRGLKQHLEGLRRTAHGQVLYRQIERGLKQYGHADGRLELVFVSFLHALLGKYAKDPACDPATRVKARMIQQRLTLYLPDRPAATAPPAPRPEPPPPKIEPPAPPVSVAPAAVAPAPPPARRSITTELEPPRRTGLMPPIPPAPPAPPAPPVVGARPAPEIPAPAAASPEPAPAPREKLEALEGTLAEQVTESIAVDAQFGELLQSEREALEKMESPLGDFNDLKQILVRGLNELIEERQALIEKLSSASEYLKAVESDRARLRTELSQARKHGMADDLTGLPKREMFVRSLESEIGRVKRYGFALSLAVIDVDGLESVNRRYGRQAGDAVLRCYAGQILSKFRTYDLVARYGGDEFAVLFPNTQKDGALHALEKARKSAAGTFISHAGKNIPLPGFSSVLTQYSPGEPAEALLKRADETLAQAKLAGVNRLVVALPAG
jgi:diguanylate cyclase (GGDEF)-like protein